MAQKLLVATRKGLFILARTGRQRSFRIARRHFLGVPVSAVLADPRDGALYAALDHGHFGSKLHRSVDQGRTFEEIAVPNYPRKPRGVSDKDPNSGQERDWKLKMIWVLEAGHSQNPGELWAGTLPGGLFKSTDRGDSWELNRALWNDPRRKVWFGGLAGAPGIHSILVHPRDPKQLVVGISCGGVWRTEDGGRTFQLHGQGLRADYAPKGKARDPETQDTHRIAQCGAASYAVWAQHHNGIFKSRDGGRTFRELRKVRPSGFGFAVAVHPKDPETAWFVPAQKDEHRVPVDGKLVVTRTRNGGKTFETLKKGLPQKDAYDIVWRHALDVDHEGQTLAFGSTSGNLFVSYDSGDSWRCLSNHLPPVHAVRFVG